MLLLKRKIGVNGVPYDYANPLIFRQYCCFSNPDG